MWHCPSCHPHARPPQRWKPALPALRMLGPRRVNTTDADLYVVPNAKFIIAEEVRVLWRFALTPWGSVLRDFDILVRVNDTFLENPTFNMVEGNVRDPTIPNAYGRVNLTRPDNSTTFITPAGAMLPQPVLLSAQPVPVVSLPAGAWLFGAGLNEFMSVSFTADVAGLYVLQMLMKDACNATTSAARPLSHAAPPP